MFQVRGVLPTHPAPPKSAVASPLPARRLHATLARRLPPPAPRSPPRTACPACDPRQHAEAFNQPLTSWDTSRVTNMQGMFWVRCSPHFAVAPLSPRHADAALARRLPPPGPQPAPHRVPCLRPSAARVRLQPAAELEHLTRDGDALHVSGRLLPARFAPDICTVQPSPLPAPCKPRSLAASRLPRQAARARTVCPACDPRQGAHAFNQPLSFGTSRVTNMAAMFHVCCSPRASPLISAQSSPLPCPLRASRARLPPPASRPAARSAPCALLATLGTGRVGLQPAPEL